MWVTFAKLVAFPNPISVVKQPIGGAQKIALDAMEFFAETGNSKAYYAVIFSSVRAMDEEGYSETFDKLEELVRDSPGYIGIESARSATGEGITVSYWENREAMRDWKQDFEHKMAQEMGRSQWYRAYRVRVAVVEREYGFNCEKTKV